MISVLWQIFEVLRWRISDELVITRECGVMVHLTEEDDLLFNHMLREDLRKLMWRQGAVISRNKLGVEVMEKGIDYGSTVRVVRMKKKPRKEGGVVMQPYTKVNEGPGMDDSGDKHVLDAGQGGAQEHIGQGG